MNKINKNNKIKKTNGELHVTRNAFICLQIYTSKVNLNKQQIK